MRSIVVPLSLSAALLAAPAAAAESQAWFYCAGLNPQTAAISASKVFAGVPARLDEYKLQTAAYLESLGLLAPGQGDVACAWAASQAAAEAELETLTTLSPGDDPSVRFVRLDWAPRPGEAAYARDGAEDLNAALKRQNAEVQARNDKAKAEFEAQAAAYEAARRDYERRLAQQQAEAAAAASAQKKYEADRAAWQAEVEALQKR